jgi:two-component system, cell cycle response regulator DivK
LTAPLVLLVDDDERNRKLVRDVLGAAGLATIEAATGAEAIALAARRRPDVVLTDLRLPDMDGAEVLHDAALAGIPVVALTAVAGARQAVLAAGFADYLEKPIDVTELPARVRGYCRNRGLAP